MAKFTDYEINPEVSDIMEALIEEFPVVFEGFNVSQVGYVSTKNKKVRNRKGMKLHSVRYPFDVWIDKAYVVEIFHDTWIAMTPKQKNLAVFHIMCMVPEGGFDEQSKNYAKQKRPDYQMFAEEFAVSGGVPDWDINDSARDPMEVKEENDGVNRIPVTAKHISEVSVAS
jgi:hypothetical protein